MFTVDIKQQHNNNNKYSQTCIKQAPKDQNVLAYYRCLLNTGAFLCICILWEMRTCSLNTGCLLHRADHYGKFYCPGKANVSDRATVMTQQSFEYLCSARAYCACSWCGWGLFGHFFSQLSFVFSSFLSLRDGPI